MGKLVLDLEMRLRFRWYAHRIALPCRFIAVAAVLIFAGMLTGCDSVGDGPDLPDIPSVPEVSFTGGSAEKGPEATPHNTATPNTATPVPQPATVPPMPAATMGLPEVPPDTAAPIAAPRLRVAEPAGDLPTYSRMDWKHWVDVDGDCQDTRAEVLIAESSAATAFASDRGCRVIAGSWSGLYTGRRFSDAAELDIDHLVPLKNAHLSGGWRWDAERKEDYANSMEANYHLVAVYKGENRAKGARGPEEWQPPDESYHCLYALQWIGVKAAWGLTATAAEWSALEEMLSKCDAPISIGDGASQVEFEAALARLGDATEGPEAMPGDMAAETSEGSESYNSSGPLVITEIMADPASVRDAAGEWFEVYNPDDEVAVNLQGWSIRDGEDDSHRIDGKVAAPPGGYLVLGRNSDSSENGGVATGYEYEGINLTNDGDVIELVDPEGRVVDRVEYNIDLVFPGASISLDPMFLDADANDDKGRWCRSSETLPNGDFGTPGQPNPPC
ncbi:MAG: DUF1524 domain-containing protein [Chloroflexi bacterium]|nr:DUF1524 domain-containing protein [Chloroflexota bacterium]